MLIDRLIIPITIGIVHWKDTAFTDVSSQGFSDGQ